MRWNFEVFCSALPPEDFSTHTHRSDFTFIGVQGLLWPAHFFFHRDDAAFSPLSLWPLDFATRLCGSCLALRKFASLFEVADAFVWIVRSCGARGSLLCDLATVLWLTFVGVRAKRGFDLGCGLWALATVFLSAFDRPCLT